MWRIVTAGAAGGVISIFTSWFLTGYLFHAFQRLTPETWRAEGPKQYALSSITQVFAGAALGVLYFATGGVSHLGTGGWLVSGVAFGLVAWTALACPVILIN